MAVWKYEVPDKELLYPLAIYRCMRHLSDILKSKQFDIVNIHHAFSGFPAEWVISRRDTLPSVFYFHGPWHKEAMSNARVPVVSRSQTSSRLSWKFRLRESADRFILKRCTAVIGLSDYMLNEAISIYPEAAEKIYKVPGGVDTERFKPAQDKTYVRKKLRIPVQKKVLLTVRRLSPRMGLENLIKAIAIVGRMRDDIVLIIGGKGELEHELRWLINELKIENTSLIGYIADDQLHQYYQASDLFIMPSVALEGFGLATLEAMACGVPVLGTPVGGTTEILKDIIPDFILSGIEAEQIAEGILNKVDLLGNVDLQKKVRSYARNYSWDRITDSVENIFRDIVDR
jgi:glycosyltransferase involved in cell wall biosynthesis